MITLYVRNGRFIGSYIPINRTEVLRRLNECVHETIHVMHKDHPNDKPLFVLVPVNSQQPEWCSCSGCFFYGRYPIGISCMGCKASRGNRIYKQIDELLEDL